MAARIRKKKVRLDMEMPEEDRFSMEERRQLMRAYEKNGFDVFQNYDLLQQYLPHRTQTNLKGLMERLVTQLVSQPQTPQHLLEWQNLCHKAMGSYAKDRKINLDDALPDALLSHKSDICDPEAENEAHETNCDLNQDLVPNYGELLKSFSSLLMGRFPQNTSKANALISMKIFDEINSKIDSIDLNLFKSLEDGSWLESSINKRRKMLELALEGLQEFDGKTRNCPSLLDVENDRRIEALCLELPKFKRIADVFNPLHIDEALFNSLN